MRKLQRGDLYSLEKYAEARSEFRRKVMEHKKRRTLPIGPNATLYFEDRLTMQYQVQEMLRVERIFEAAGIEEELAAYNPLIPDGSNWKATYMVEFSDIEERRKALARFVGIEAKTWLRVAGHDKIYPFADEDMERASEEKTSSVHFLRFELTPAMIRDLKSGAGLAAGSDHPEYRHTLDPVPDALRESLLQDLDPLGE